MMRIDKNIPGGNVVVQSISDNEAVLSKEMRGTSGTWFYWKFRAAFDRSGDYRFRFVDGASIGSRGAAFSLDEGLTWSWTGQASADFAHESFAYHADSSCQVWFCVCIPYMESDLARFLADVSIEKGELCRSRCGRGVELLKIGSGSKIVFLTSRHHAQESMATYAMEGMLREIVEHPEDFKDFTIYAVPFMDKDGVENGDQGKNRQPRDHARDYGDNPIYPEVNAAMKLIRNVQPRFVFDMHCPWLRSNCNEYVYFVGQKNPRLQEGIDRFSAILERFAPASFPYHSSDNMPYGTSWNTGANYTQGSPLVPWCGDLPWKPHAQSIEIPFANCREVTLDADAARLFGVALAKSMREFLS